MSKSFNGTTDLISLGSPAALDNLIPVTYAAWVYPVSAGEGGSGRIYNKTGAGDLIGVFWHIGGTPGGSAHRIVFDYSSSDASASGGNSILTPSAWNFVAATYTTGDGGPRLWYGSPSAGVVEETGATRVAEGGAYAGDAAATAHIGNRGNADRTFDGPIAHLSVWDQVLTVGQLNRLRLFPYASLHRFSVGAGTIVKLKGYWPLWESAPGTCIDHSQNQNAGTVTGTSVAAEPPFTFMWRGARATIWTPAAAAAATAGAGRGPMYPRMQRTLHQSWTVPRGV